MRASRDFSSPEWVAFLMRSLLLSVLLIPALSFAQQTASAPRADGASTPLMVYAAQGDVHGCAPLALLSHGAGGSERGLAYLARAMSEQGWTAIVMGHRESGREVAVSLMRKNGGRRGGLQALITTPKAMEARLMDIGAALAWQQKRCAPPYKVLMGHSMGAETVEMEAGAPNKLGVKGGADRFDAYVILSGMGVGAVFPAKAWGEFHKPVLVMTGTLDKSLETGEYTWRTEPFREMPTDGQRACHWLGAVDGATHADFGGNGDEMQRVGPIAISTVKAFVAGARAGKCVLPAGVAGLDLKAK
ncbi:MAG: alpha/beta hydrolase [Acidobacteria bacterium]|nr:alpha/beta hydrolase [Acidobacteriota bacterium]